MPRQRTVQRRREGRRARRPGRGHRHASAPIAIASIRTRPCSRRIRYALYPDSQYRFTHFSKTHGYANQPLDGIWLRGPYLHNGSVPTLRDLLEPPERRPARVLPRLRRDRSNKVGFVSNVARPTAGASSVYDTSVPGNGNGGHTVRRDAAGCGQAGDRRIPEDVLTRRVLGRRQVRRRQRYDHGVSMPGTQQGGGLVRARGVAGHPREFRAGHPDAPRARSAHRDGESAAGHRR